MTKILNIDALAKAPERTITLSGTTHPVKEMSVGLFIDATARAKDTEEKTLDQQIQSTVDLILQYVPTLSRDELLSLSFEQLGILSGFIRGGVDVDADGNVVRPEAETGDDGKAASDDAKGDDAKK